MFSKDQKSEKKDIELIEFEQEGVRFSIPKRVTVRQQSLYIGAVTMASSEEWLVKRWEAARTLIKEWECDIVKSLDDFDIDNLYDPKITNVMQFVALSVMGHMNKLDDTEKNS